MTYLQNRDSTEKLSSNSRLKSEYLIWEKLIQILHQQFLHELLIRHVI